MKELKPLLPHSISICSFICINDRQIATTPVITLGYFGSYRRLSKKENKRNYPKVVFSLSHATRELTNRDIDYSTDARPTKR